MTLTYKEYLAKSRAFQDQWDRSVQTVTDIRDGVPHTQAAKNHGIRFETVFGLVGSALRKLPNGRYVAKPTDQLLRVLPLPGKQGQLQWIPTRDSREASIIGKYWDAVQSAVRKGDSSALQKLPRKYVITESGERVPLLTDFRELKRVAHAGEFRFESIYGRRA